jgi:hypothetical protein
MRYSQTYSYACWCLDLQWLYTSYEMLIIINPTTTPTTNATIIMICIIIYVECILYYILRYETLTTATLLTMVAIALLCFFDFI